MSDDSRLLPTAPVYPQAPDQSAYPSAYIDATAAGVSPLQARFFSLLRRKWWVLLITVGAMAAAAIYFLIVRTPTYASQAVMWVSSRLQLPDGARFSDDALTFFGTQLELLRSGRIQERALARVKSVKPGFVAPKDDKGKDKLPKLHIAQTPKSGVFGLESRDSNSEFTQLFLDALMDEFLAYKKEVRITASGEALASVSETVYKQEHELKIAQDKLAAFQQDNNVALLQEQVNGGGSHLAQLQSQLSMLGLELHLLDAAELEQSVGTQLKTNLLAAAPDPRGLTQSAAGAATLPVDFITANQLLQNLKVQRDQLSRYLRPKHPKIVKLDDDIARSEKVIAFFRGQTMDQLATAKQAMRIRIESLAATIKEIEGRVGDANRRLAEMEKIRGEILRQQSLYDRILTLLQGVDLNRNLDQENVTILQRASAPEPANRPALLILAAAIMAGGFAGTALLFLVAWSSDTCDSLDQVRGHFAEEIVGQVPEVRRGRKARKQPLLLEPDDPRHVFAESCRSLRSSIIYQPTQGPRPKTLLVTSAAPGEGKSTIAVNVARALALGRSRVLLIDADLRRGRLHDLLGAAAGPGLAELLSNSGRLKEFIIATALPSLSFLPGGTADHNSSELFLTRALDDLLEEAREQFDYVIIDSIPVFAADDTTTLAPRTDGVLFVVRRSHTSARLASQALELLYQRQVKVLGLIFNRANSEASSYRYYKYAKYYRAAASS